MKPTYSINYIPRIDFKTAYQSRLVSGLFWSLSVLQGGQVEILFSSAMSWIKDGTIAIILVHSRSSTPNLLHKCLNSGTRNALSNFIFDINEVKVSAHYSSSCNSNSHSTITWTLWWFICAVFRLLCDTVGSSWGRAPFLPLQHLHQTLTHREAMLKSQSPPMPP